MSALFLIITTVIADCGAGKFTFDVNERNESSGVDAWLTFLHPP